MLETIPRRLSADKACTRPEDVDLLIFVLILGLCSLETLFHSVQQTIHLADLYSIVSNRVLFDFFDSWHFEDRSCRLMRDDERNACKRIITKRLCADESVK